jgi:predicted metalloprotease
MRWTYGRESDNVEDARGGGGGLGGPVMIGGGGIGIVVLALVAMFFGVDPRVVLNLAGGGGQQGGYEQPARPAQDTGPQGEQVQFVRRVMASTEDVWTALFRQMNARYDPPKLVLFSDAVQSACGMAQSATGPFYCPGDQKVYLDLSFFDELSRRFGAPGDFARAYVIAHEVGHHVQDELGITRKVESARRQAGQEQANHLSVMVELQADCLAGVWANHANQKQKILEPGDVQEGIQAAAAVGDDRLQKQARGYVVPDSFTHGSSAQRVRWFRRGIESGDIGACNTFGASQL